jgi:hypothetical protein
VLPAGGNCSNGFKRKWCVQPGVIIMNQVFKFLVSNTVRALRAPANSAASAVALPSLSREQLRAVSGGTGTGDLPKGTW